jgi:hypothetical protein
MAQLESPTVGTHLLNPFSAYFGTDDDGHGSPWQGMFADLRFYSGALSVSQIAAMYAPTTRWDLYTPSGGSSSAIAAPAGAGTPRSSCGIAGNTPAQRLPLPSGSNGSGGQATYFDMMPLPSTSSIQSQTGALSSTIEVSTSLATARSPTAIRPEIKAHKLKRAAGHFVVGPPSLTIARRNHVTQRATDVFAHGHRHDGVSIG